MFDWSNSLEIMGCRWITSSLRHPTRVPFSKRLLVIIFVGIRWPPWSHGRSSTSGQRTSTKLWYSSGRWCWKPRNMSSRRTRYTWRDRSSYFWCCLPIIYWTVLDGYTWNVEYLGLRKVNDPPTNINRVEQLITKYLLLPWEFWIWFLPELFVATAGWYDCWVGAWTDGAGGRNILPLPPPT